jgi:hypothetical protein
MAEEPVVSGTLIVPDKDPYEGNASLKQKQFIWELGYHDQTVIDKLGKKQASAVIDQLIQSRKSAYEPRSIKRGFIWSILMILAAIAALVGGRYSHEISESGWANAVLVFGSMGGLLLLLFTTVRWGVLRLKK